jgi:hypothetical protein
MDKVDDLNFKETMLAIEKEKEELGTFTLNCGVITEAAFIKYPFLRDAINKLGFAGIAECGYIITNVKAKHVAQSDKGVENKIYLLLKNKRSLATGEFIETAKLKADFASIYAELGLKKTGKGTDITNYYDVKETKKTINGKSVKGYLIIRSKMIFN